MTPNITPAGGLRASARHASPLARSRALGLLLITTLSTLPAAVHALTIRVPADQPTIQAALDAASSGDSVLVAAGTYTGADNRDLDFDGNDIVLLSESGPEKTIIDAEATFGDQHGLQFDQGESPNARVIGFTITRAYGGGATCENGSSPSFDRCIFTQCDGVDGGGVKVDNASPAFTDCTFSRNTPGTAGGAELSASQSTFLRCTFVDNGADSEAGASVEASSNVVFTNCVFESNQAGDLGDVWAGGLSVDSGSTATLEDCLLTGNEARSADGGEAKGGAIYVASANLIVRRCTFVGNFADVGGAIKLEDSSVEITDSIFRQNRADQGGGIAGELGTLQITSCTLYDNAGNSGANGISVSAGTAVTVTRVLIAFGSSGEGLSCAIPADVKIGCSDIFGNPGGDWIGCIAGQLGNEGNIAADPLFCHPDTGEMSIANSSPCAPPQSPCGLIGAVGPGCQTAVVPTTWGSIKASFGEPRRAQPD